MSDNDGNNSNNNNGPLNPFDYGDPRNTLNPLSPISPLSVLSKGGPAIYNRTSTRILQAGLALNLAFVGYMGLNAKQENHVAALESLKMATAKERLADIECDASRSMTPKVRREKREEAHAEFKEHEAEHDKHYLAELSSRDNAFRGSILAVPLAAATALAASMNTKKRDRGR